MPLYFNVIVLSALALLMSGCSAQGHVRVRDSQLLGTYVTDFHSGKEQLILRSDKTYEQVFSSPTRKFTNHGKWESHYVLLEGTDVELFNVNCSEDNAAATGSCERTLNVHWEDGKLKLALNETSDWYYDRTD